MPGETLEALRWLEQMVKTLDAASAAAPVESSGGCSPGATCLRRLRELMGGCRTQRKACVFTLADDRLAKSLLECHARGVQVCVPSDNNQAARRRQRHRATEPGRRAGTPR